MLCWSNCICFSFIIMVGMPLYYKLKTKVALNLLWVGIFTTSLYFLIDIVKKENKKKNTSKNITSYTNNQNNPNQLGNNFNLNSKIRPNNNFQSDQFNQINFNPPLEG